MRPRHYDRKGQPITRDEWGRLFENEADRLVLSELLPGGLLVSTIWMGLDHNHSGVGPPRIFETMVFSPLSPGDDLDMRRYSTEEQARAGHAEMVARWRGVRWAVGEHLYRERVPRRLKKKMRVL